MDEDTLLFPCRSHRTIRSSVPTSAVNRAGKIEGGSDPYRQAVYALKNIEKALRETGVKLADVIRTRIYLARFEDWEAVAKAHAEMFHDNPPAVV